ncbi:bifunctional diguanylate cyclase/phosphodiesterase [Pseudomonas psychrophila]|uniref:cyclic-guanylate-specific phosphodiesterase n=1 Tax=Pseudomonas psychrophila TaxID=122355 RepID=A0A8I1FLN8_9PSED|nr:EAL domain-containing protein [Pseudomonas psychrophila]KAB0493321.1 EAL domain-containing protein [Pseudomonas psychrophila]KMN02806.1 diguanylate phosphodiesterase [Pseudomonas psychrophila]MBJ2255094.1 EAL domain-containing protein [Pseudomonas psychrophila]QIE32217.1 EAL domain-containing protein [Pseudomonas psychrophila]WVI98762.1 EAL domain-containing protein [Pseudomonas psychrophila]
MERLGLQLLGEPSDNAQLLLIGGYSPYLVFLAWLVACTACLATLNLLDRCANAEKAAAKNVWRWISVSCLATGIWAMYTICLLAFESPLESRYSLAVGVGSLLTALIAALVIVQVFNHITTWRSSTGLLHQLFKYGLCMAAAGILLCACFFSMSAFGDTPASQSDADSKNWQLALVVALIALLLIGSCISAAIVDKKLQLKEHDLRRVNALLSQLDQARASLQQVAHYDPLTNLINRRGFNQLFAEKLIDCTARNSKLAVMFLDIDHFKRINDSLGHDAGDELLKVIAARIKHATRSHDDVVARFGGDEFCILINLSHHDEAQSMGHRIMLKLKEPIELSGRQMVMTTSIGISVFPQDGITSAELLKHADLALYQSKGNGRNNLTFFSPNLKTRASLELQIEEELRNALNEDKGLFLHYQPIFDLKNGRVAKLEALVRWQHPEHGLLGPDRFISIAEANGLIAELDHWVLRKACHDLAALSRQGWQHLGIAVNCSARNLVRVELADEIESALRTSGIAAHRLELEVTENALMCNLSSTSQLLRQIRALGVSLSIDDFGTGYSSLAYLKRLPLNTLKIDRSFIQDIPTSSQDMEIVQAIILMAHTLHLQVVTEGVETTQQFEFLNQFGCDFIQGYLLSRPVPFEALQEILEQLDKRPVPAADHTTFVLTRQ